MATQIIATRKQRSSEGDHVHVAAALTMDRRQFSRSELVQRITNGWESFYTEYQGRRANVYVRHCGACGIDYATTKPDGTVKNNLLHLSDF